MDEPYEKPEPDDFFVGRSERGILIRVGGRLYELDSAHAHAISQLLFAQCASLARPKDP